jgi:hypothetical protein
MLAMLVMMLGISFLKHTDYIVDYFKDWWSYVHIFKVNKHQYWKGCVIQINISKKYYWIKRASYIG